MATKAGSDRPARHLPPRRAAPHPTPVHMVVQYALPLPSAALTHSYGTGHQVQLWAMPLVSPSHPGRHHHLPHRPGSHLPLPAYLHKTSLGTTCRGANGSQGAQLGAGAGTVQRVWWWVLFTVAGLGRHGLGGRKEAEQPRSSYKGTTPL